MNRCMVKIRCFFADSIDAYRFHIFVYDLNGNLIDEEYANESGCFNFDVGFSGIYRIIVRYFGKNCTMTMCKNIYVDCFRDNDFLFIIKRKSHYVPSPIIIKLTDQYYKGLPVEKGEIIFSGRS